MPDVSHRNRPPDGGTRDSFLLGDLQCAELLHLANAFANAIGQSLRQASPLRWQRPLGLDEQHRPGLANDDEVDFPTRIIVAGSEEPGMAPPQELDCLAEEHRLQLVGDVVRIGTGIQRGEGEDGIAEMEEVQD